MMDERRLKVGAKGALFSDAFFEASREELRVLVAIMERPLTYSTDEEVAEAAGVSRARAAAAIALFLGEGVLIREGDVSYEFDGQVKDADPIVRGTKEIADTIRKKSLADLFHELAEMMGKETLNTDECTRLTGLIEDYALTEDYVITLAQYLTSKSSLSVKKLIDKAKKFDARNVHTAEELEEYIKNEEDMGDLEHHFRRVFKKYDQRLSKSELEYFRKWTETYGYSDSIIELAIDINTLSKTNYQYPYLDKLLTRWHECGCTTLNECRIQAEQDRIRISEERKTDRAPATARSKKSEAPTPKYGDFDPTEALERAIAKSFAKYTADEETK